MINGSMSDWVHKQFGSLRALQGVDMEIRQGEFFALLGSNGAGKIAGGKRCLGVMS